MPLVIQDSGIYKQEHSTMKVFETDSPPIGWVENGQLPPETKKLLWQSIHGSCKSIPQDSDLAQELIEERRITATVENQ